jgi:predicted alpha/beta hydrolase family esterase
VILPRFPIDDWDQLTQKGKSAITVNQTLTHWLNTLKPYINQIKVQPTCVVAHSLGPLFILHAIKEYALSFDCGIFAAPFLEHLNTAWQIDTANATFYHPPNNLSKIHTQFSTRYVIYSDNDPYVDTKYTEQFISTTKSQSIIAKGGGHLSKSAGYTQFPLVLELCKTRIPQNK